MHSKVKIFSGTSNVLLAEKIAKGLNLKLSEIEIIKFQDGEISVLIKENLNGCHCFVVQPVCKPVNDNLMEFLKQISEAKVDQLVIALVKSKVIPYNNIYNPNLNIGKTTNSRT